MAGAIPCGDRRAAASCFTWRSDGGMMAASITLSPRLSLGRVTKLFAVQRPPLGITGRGYDISPIDGRFLINRAASAGSDAPINISVVLNWFEELRQRVPRK